MAPEPQASSAGRCLSSSLLRAAASRGRRPPRATFTYHPARAGTEERPLIGHPARTMRIRSARCRMAAGCLWLWAISADDRAFGSLGVPVAGGMHWGEAGTGSRNLETC